MLRHGTSGTVVLAEAGKSWAMRRKFVLLCLNYPYFNALLLRRTFPELRENHVIPLLKELNGIAKYRGEEKVFLFPNGSRLKLGYCEHEQDVYQYQGQEYDVIGLEEATMFTESQMQFLTTCNRSTRTDFSPRMYYTANPGGVGMAWFKRLFIDREYRELEKTDDYVFIPARVYDNKVLMTTNPGYVDTLKNLPEDLRRAHLEGDWDVFVGQFFCYDSETEILTVNGWKNVLDIGSGENVATLDPGGQLHFLPSSASHVFDYNGELFCHSGLALDFAVTPGHKMYCYKQGANNVYEFIDVEKMPVTSRHLRTALSWQGIEQLTTTISEDWPYAHTKVYTFNTDDWLELLGWYLSEGSIEKNFKGAKTSNPIRGFNITQSYHQDKIERIHNLLKRMGLKYWFGNKRFVVSSVVLARYFSQFGKHSVKFIPRHLFNLHPKHLIHLYNGLMLGDGCPRDNQAFIYSTTSKQLADDIQELCLRLSKVATISLVKPKKESHSLSYRISIYGDGHTESIVRQRNIKHKTYQGKVACVTVEPFHTVYVRRNGKAFWCGNSEFSREKHVIPPFELPSHWRRFRSLDWGFNDYSAVYWHAIAPDKRVYTYRELYVNQTLASDLAEKIKELSKDEQVVYTVASPDMWQKRGGGYVKGESIADTFHQRGLYLRKADNNRVIGWQRCREFMATAPDGLPYWQIFENCANLIRTLPALIYDEHDSEDVSDSGEQDAADAIRYGLMSRPRPNPEEKLTISGTYAVGELRMMGYSDHQIRKLADKVKIIGGRR